MISANLKSVIIEIGIKYTANHHMTFFMVFTAEWKHSMAMWPMKCFHSAVNITKLLNLRSLVSSR